MTPADKQEILEALVRNGIRHLDRGVTGFADGQLDFAVSDAFFGIEILLKALVFHGQWELIFEEPGDADPQKLKTGNCRTIGLDQAEKRLGNLLHRPLPSSSAHFKKLKAHRNKLIHFFHPSLSNDSERKKVARDLANSWNSFRQLRAMPDFRDVFTPHQPALSALEARLLVINQFLDDQEASIRAEHPEPATLTECIACKRKTFSGMNCLLCGYHEPSHRDLTQGAEFIGPADCPECGEMETVRHAGNASRCTECGAAFEAIGTCGYCNEPFVQRQNSDPADDYGSFYYGCDKCDGRLGALNEDD